MAKLERLVELLREELVATIEEVQRERDFHLGLEVVQPEHRPEILPEINRLLKETGFTQ
jgi:hypothetical protein